MRKPFPSMPTGAEGIPRSGCLDGATQTEARDKDPVSEAVGKAPLGTGGDIQYFDVGVFLQQDSGGFIIILLTGHEFDLIVGNLQNITQIQTGINLKQGGKWDCTTYRYDAAGEIIYGKAEYKGEGAKSSSVSGALPNENGKITMEIYIDRSLVEGFFNNRKAVSIRAYTENPDSHGINLFAVGDVTIESLYVASMGSIFD